MSVKTVLYNAGGVDKEISADEIGSARLNDHKLLWIDLSSRDEAELAGVAEQLGVSELPCNAIVSRSRRPRLASFEDFFTISVDSIATTENEPPVRQPIDIVVGKNYVITVHDDTVRYFEEYKAREMGETHIGELDAESFLAALLDEHIVSYFRAVEYVEARVDALDEKVIRVEVTTEAFLNEMVKLRRLVSDLRSWLIPHRGLIYTFSRSDFTRIGESGSTEQFKLLAQHFESAVEGVEACREKVLGTFSLYATKSDQIMNTFIQRLTFFTVLIGTMGVMAGALGMNFKADVFEAENGFWITVGFMILLAIVVTYFARARKWI